MHSILNKVLTVGNEKVFRVEIPIAGEIHIFETDLICNSCGKRIKNEEYLYFCAKCKDDLCSGYNCLKKHAGHSFFRFGKIQSESSIDEMIASRPAPPKGTSKPPIKISAIGLPMAPPMAPAAGPPAPPTKDPTINTGISILRTDMLKELKRLKCIMEKKI